MATTPKGIYYPNDYNEIADIPEDMKKMAESIEEVFEDTDSDLSGIKEEQTTQNNRLNSLEVDNTTNKSDILTNKQEINNIKTEQTTQNNRLSNLETDNTTNKNNISANTQEINNIKQEQTEQNTNISTNATNIESLQEENENLKKVINQLPQVEGQGTSITLENTIEAQFTKFDVEGNSTQAILPEEYQQVDYIESTGTQYIDTGYTPVQGDNFEIKNVTTKSNGMIFYSGTGENQLGIFVFDNDGYYKYFATGAASHFLSPNVTNETIKIINGDLYYGKTLKAQSSYVGVLNTTLQIFRRPTGIDYISAEMGRFTITNGNTIKLDLIPCYKKSNNEIGFYDIINDVFYTNQGTGTFLKGNNVPNPSYEQPIESAGDNENLFDGELELGTLGSTGANNNSTTDIRSKNYVTVDEQETYTISSDKGTSTSLRFYDANKTFISTLTGASMPRTFESPENAKYVRFVIPNTTDINAKVKLEKSTQATPYSPYGMGSINEKINNKNFWSLNSSYSSTGYATLLNQANFKLKKGNYILSFEKVTVTSSILFRFFNKDKSSYYDARVTPTSKTPILNALEDIYYVTLIFNEADSLEGIQLEPGSTATPYVEHEEQDYPIFVQQPFRSIGDVRDLFFKNTVDSPYYDENLTLNGWYERHYIGEKILNGTESWEIYNTHIYLYDNTFKASVESNDYVPNYKCNYFIPDSLFNANTSPNGKILQNVWGALAKHKGIAFNSQDTFSDVATLKTWLSTHNVVVQYELETPLDLPCTPEQIQQLENKPSTYKDFTTINSEDETEAYLEVSGIYDLNKLITRTEVLESEV